MKVSVSNIVTALFLLFGGYALGQTRHGPTQVQSVRDTVAIAQYRDRLDNLRMENDGLRSMLEGVESRPPDTIFVVDTLTTPPDTVFEFVTVQDGRLTAGALVRPRPSTPDSVPTSLYRPELHAGSDVSDCDEGFEVGPAGVICDRAALGHLYVGPWLSLSRPALALWWEPSYRSPWEAYVSYSDEGWDAGVRRGVKVF